jgi:hypothetical protein
VLRPLADALRRAGTAGPADDPTLAGEAGPTEAAGSLTPGTSQARTAAAAAQRRPETAPERVWALAQAATELRSRLGRAGNCPVELAEATAALQDLACRIATPAEVETRRGELWRLQSGLPAGIQAERNGPYLVTNVPTLIDHLGAEQRRAPQPHLCRQGSPRAVPDRRSP